MNKKILCGALLGALGLVQVAVADDFDDRWYVSGTVGIMNYDNARPLQNDNMLGIGFGKFFAPRWSWDVQVDYTNPEKDGSDLNYSMYSGSLVGRYHFRDEAETWWPYVSFGAGVQRHEEEFPNPRGGQPIDRRGNDLLAQVGFGLMADYGRANWRAEVGARYDADDQSNSRDGYFLDAVASVSVLVKLGAAPTAMTAEPAPVVPAAPVKTCADMDDDGDGVNNCDDKCPNSVAGQAIGPDGCPVPLTIDLRGVNFDFDKATLRPDAQAILTEAVSILQKYPQLRVEVAGHTDQCGSEGYNQDLSARRASVVYDYLVSAGIESGRMAGPNGFGESRPLEQMGDSFPGCKSETNRRTELNVQN